MHVLSHIESTVAGSKLGHVWIAVVAWTYYVSIYLQIPRGKPAWTSWVTEAFFIAFQAFQKVLKKLLVRVKEIAVGFGVGFCSLSYFF
jgi:hypothetical protein